MFPKPFHYNYLKPFPNRASQLFSNRCLLIRYNYYACNVHTGLPNKAEYIALLHSYFHSQDIVLCIIQKDAVRLRSFIIWSTFLQYVGWRHSKWWYFSGRVHTNSPLSSMDHLLNLASNTWDTHQLCHRMCMLAYQLWTHSQTHSTANLSFIPGPDPAPSGGVEVHIRCLGTATGRLLSLILCSQLMH